MREILGMVSRIFGVGYKVFIIFAVCVTVISVFAYTISHDNVKTTYDPVEASRQDFKKNIQDPRYAKDPQARAVLKLYSLGVCGMVGELCDVAGIKITDAYQTSLFGKLSTAVAYPYANPPASGIAWINDQMEHAGLVPKSYAAEGIGFAGLKPLAGIWKLFRDISYTLIVLLIVVLGFLIMFRFKINPQTVVTIENSLPRIFVTLLLITFSFAIGGLMIDLMYVASSVIVTVLGSYQLPTVVNSTTAATGATVTMQPYLSYKDQMGLVTQGYGMQMLSHVFWKPQILELGSDLLSIAPIGVNLALRGITSLGTILLLNKISLFNKVITGDFLSGIAETGGFPGFIFTIIFWLIIPVLLASFAPILLGLIIMFTTGIFVFITLLILLIKAYLRIIFNIIFSPLILLSGAIPGRSAFSNWIRGLVADLIVFPTVITVIMVAGIIARIPTEQGNIWQAPLIYNSLNPHAFRMIVSVGLLFWTKDIVAAMRKLIGVKPSGVPGFGIATVAGGLAGGMAGGGMMQKLSQYASIRANASTLPFGVGRLLGGGKGGAKPSGGVAHESNAPSFRTPTKWYSKLAETTKNRNARLAAGRDTTDSGT